MGLRKIVGSSLKYIGIAGMVIGFSTCIVHNCKATRLAREIEYKGIDFPYDGSGVEELDNQYREDIYKMAGYLGAGILSFLIFKGGDRLSRSSRRRE